MRLAAKWQGTWPFSSSTPEGVLRTRIRVGGELVDLVRMGTGDPLIVVPGLAGSWGLLLPLARRLARRFEVITYGLRGDGFPAPGFSGPRSAIWDIAGHAEDLASLIDQLGLEPGRLWRFLRRCHCPGAGG